MQTYQGKYPVISLGLKDVQGDNYKEVVMQIKKELASLFNSHSYLLKSTLVTKDEQTLYKKYMKEKATIVDVTRGLSFLSELLKKHFRKPVYIFVDEYDAPINEAYTTFSTEEWKRILKFFSRLFSTTFKTNPHLEKGPHHRYTAHSQGKHLF